MRADPELRRAVEGVLEADAATRNMAPLDLMDLADRCAQAAESWVENNSSRVDW